MDAAPSLMDLETLRDFLGWCALLGFGLLLWWWGFLCFAHGLVYRLHTRWFELSRERFDALHYGGMMGFKLAVFLLFVVPYLALRIIA